MPMSGGEAVECALHCGFSYAAMLPPRVFDSYRPNEDSARQGIGNDPFALMPNVRSILIAAMPHGWYAKARDTSAEVSAYYIQSQHAHQAANALSLQLQAGGAQVYPSPSLPLKLLGLEAGIGVFGKNTLLHNTKWGTCFTMRALLTDLPPQDCPAPLEASPCGSCRRCIDACPTGALRGDGSLDTALCLRTHMLSGSPTPPALRPKMGMRLIGCETCQRICPYNRHTALAPPPDDVFDIKRLLQGKKEDIAAASHFIGGNHARKERMLAQYALVAGNSNQPEYLPLLKPLANHERPAIAAHARWAIDRLKGGASC